MHDPGDDQYYTIEDIEAIVENRVSDSRFIASIFFVRTKREAEDRYDRVKRKYHNATHNCFAYRINDTIYRYSDDGEPSGTAGRPILQILEQKQLHNVLIVITRYFGGTKLGTGGLSRAYAEAAKKVLEKVKIIVKIKYKTISLMTDYDYMSDVLLLINRCNGLIGKTDYAEKVQFSVQIPCSRFISFQNEINVLINRGLVQFHIAED